MNLGDVVVFNSERFIKPFRFAGRYIRGQKAFIVASLAEGSDGTTAVGLWSGCNDAEKTFELTDSNDPPPVPIVQEP